MAQDVEVIALLTGILGEPIVLERLANAAGIIPGDLLEVNSTNKLLVHNSAGAVAERMFALPDLPVAGDIDTSYASGDTVRAGVFHAGQRVNARLAAAAPAVVIGDFLESAGDGTLRKVIPTVVLTDNSGGAATDTIAAITAEVIVTLTDNSTGAGTDVIAAITEAVIVTLTDNSGGAAADDTIAVITNAANAGSADVAPVADAIADLAGKINEFQVVGVVVPSVIADAVASLADKVNEILAVGVSTPSVIADGVASLAAKVNEILAFGGANNVVAVAEESVDNSGGGTKVRIEARII